jgi:hypothetical protein
MGVEEAVGKAVGEVEEAVEEVVEEAVTVAAEEEAAEVEECGPKVGTNLFVGSRFEKHGFTVRDNSNNYDVRCILTR